VLSQKSKAQKILFSEEYKPMKEKSSLPPLPRRTVKYVVDPEEMNEAGARGMLSNPVYVGVPPYNRVVSDEAWVRAAVKLIEEDGPEQFLVNLLYMLRVSMVDAVPDEAIPNDYDGPWPEDNEHELSLDEEVTDDVDETSSPWQNPMEGLIFCSHDDLPMILMDGEFVCVGEYLYAHLDNAPVTDLMTDPVLTLVFQNGHTLPLLCPDCGDSLHINDQTALLDSINGLTIVALEWDDENEELVIEFGRVEAEEDEAEVLESLSIHLNSVRGLTCPYQTLWHEEDEEDLA
jgi:hypothetical protein